MAGGVTNASRSAGALHVGTHSRENRRGRTGADSAYVLHAGTPGFGFESGEVRAVHTGWSGNHVHYAERTFTGEAVIGGGELLLPGEVRLGPASRTHPVGLLRLGRGARRGRPALPPPPPGAAPAGVQRRAR